MATNSTTIPPTDPTTTAPTVTPTPTPSTSQPPPPPPPPSTSTTTTTPSATSSSSTIVPPTSSSTSTTPTLTPTPSSTTIVTTDPGGQTITTVQTVTATPSANPNDSGTAPPASTTSGGAAINPTDGSSAGLNNSGKIAVAVVVPIAAVALLVLAGIFLWRKRKQRKDAEEQRRKEVEEYGYNPNADPTIPALAGAGAGAGQYEMREDGSSGYRGWGSTTLAGSTGRKASTTMSGGGAYSDATSPTRGGVSDTRSGEPLMADRGSPTPDGEVLGAMGPSVANNVVNVHRGPSNASSQYSTGARSDRSDDFPVGAAYGGNTAYDQYGNENPYSDAPNRQGPAEMAGTPVIRDVTARRNTRIENPAHYPQQTAGISQNF